MQSEGHPPPPALLEIAPPGASESHDARLPLRPHANTWGEKLRERLDENLPTIVEASAAGSAAVGNMGGAGVIATTANFLPGPLWLGSALGSELHNLNQPTYSKWAGGTNIPNIFAAGLATMVALTPNESPGYSNEASALLAGTSACVTVADAVRDKKRNWVSRVLQGGSGLSNFAGSYFALRSLDESDKHDSASAAWHSGASSVAWLAGTILSLAANYTASSSAPDDPSLPNAPSTPLLESPPTHSSAPAIQRPA